MFCPKCGKQIKDGIKFCPYCGNPIANTAQGNQNNSQRNQSQQSTSSYNGASRQPYDQNYRSGSANIIEQKTLFKYFMDCLKYHFKDFDGRARRKEFWGFTLFYMIISFIPIILIIAILAAVLSDDGSIGGSVFLSLLTILLLIANLVLIVPALAVTVRRLHDIGKGGAYIFIGLVPVVGYILMLIMLCSEGTRGDNMYGPDPKRS